MINGRKKYRIKCEVRQTSLVQGLILSNINKPFELPVLLYPMKYQHVYLTCLINKTSMLIFVCWGLFVTTEAITSETLKINKSNENCSSNNAYRHDNYSSKKYRYSSNIQFPFCNCNDEYIILSTNHTWQVRISFENI